MYMKPTLETNQLYQICAETKHFSNFLKSFKFLQLHHNKSLINLEINLMNLKNLQLPT